VDKDTGRRRFRISIGPLGMSLAAAAVTAVAFAAVSLADNGSGGNGSGTSTQTFEAPGPGPGAGVGITTIRGNLSDADKQKLEDFRQCMQDNGAPAPPSPGDFDPSNPPKPPSAADQEKLRKAWEACKDKLPTDMQNAGPPQLRMGGCAPPPGTPGTNEKGNKQNQDQSNDSGSSSSGSSS
jgi:hypothetical protein